MRIITLSAKNYKLSLTCSEIRLFLHNKLETGASIVVLAHFDEQQPNVLHDFRSDRHQMGRHLIQGHSILFQRVSILPQTEMQVSDVES